MVKKAWYSPGTQIPGEGNADLRLSVFNKEHFHRK